MLAVDAKSTALRDHDWIKVVLWVQTDSKYFIIDVPACGHLLAFLGQTYLAMSLDLNYWVAM